MQPHYPRRRRRAYPTGTSNPTLPLRTTAAITPPIPAAPAGTSPPAAGRAAPSAPPASRPVPRGARPTDRCDHSTRTTAGEPRPAAVPDDPPHLAQRQRHLVHGAVR